MAQNYIKYDKTGKEVLRISFADGVTVTTEMVKGFKKVDDFPLPEIENPRIAEINKRLNQLVFEAAKNTEFYKNVDQSTLEVTWQEKHDEIVAERNNLIIELGNLK